MDSLRSLLKYSIPTFFVIGSIILLYKGTQTYKVDNAVCFQQEFDASKDVVYTRADLKGNYADLVEKEKKLKGKVKAKSEESKAITDTIAGLKKAFNEGKVDTARYLKITDSLSVVDSIKVTEFNKIENERYRVSKTIQNEIDYQQSLIRDRGEIKPVVVQQNKHLLYGGLVMLLASILMFLFIANVITPKLTFILIPIFVIVAVIMIFFTGKEIVDLERYNQKRIKAYSETKQRLLDIREALLLYKEQNKRYPDNIDELIEFIKTGETYDIHKEKDLPNNRYFKPYEAFRYYSGIHVPIENGDSTAFKQVADKWVDTTKVAFGDSLLNIVAADMFGIIVRDTTNIPIIEKLYTGITAKPRDSEWPFNADSLKHMAYFTDIKFVYRDTVVTVEEEQDSGTVEIKKPRFEIRLEKPLYMYDTDHGCERPIELIIGSLYEDNTTGNWSK